MTSIGMVGIFFRQYRTPAEYKMRPYSKRKYPSSSFSAWVKGSLKLSLHLFCARTFSEFLACITVVSFFLLA